MNNEINNIAYFVEKISKGVKKQLKGYVKNVQDEINFSVQINKNAVSEFKYQVDSTKYLRKDLAIIEVMQRETMENKALLLEMKKLYNELQNLFMDNKLLHIEIKQSMAIYKIDISNLIRELNSK